MQASDTRLCCHRSAVWCNLILPLIFCHFLCRRQRSTCDVDMLCAWCNVVHLRRATLSFSYSWKADVDQQTSGKFLSQSPSEERHGNLDSTLLQLNPSDSLIMLTLSVISVVWCVCRDSMAWALCAASSAREECLVNWRATGFLGDWVGSVCFYIKCGVLELLPSVTSLVEPLCEVTP